MLRESTQLAITVSLPIHVLDKIFLFALLSWYLLFNEGYERSLIVNVRVLSVKYCVNFQLHYPVS